MHRRDSVHKIHESSSGVGPLGTILLIIFSIVFSSYLSLLIRLYFEGQILSNLNDFLAKFYNYFNHLAKMDIIFLSIFFMLLLPTYKLSHKLTRYIARIFLGSKINYRRKSIAQSSTSFFSKARGKDKAKAALQTIIMFATVAFLFLYFRETYIVILAQGFLRSVHDIILAILRPFGLVISALGFDVVAPLSVAYLVVIFLCFSITAKYVFLASLFFVGQTSCCSACKAVFANSDAGIETIERFTEWQNESTTRNGKQYTESVPYNVHRYWKYTSCDICNHTTRSEKVEKTKGSGGGGGHSAGEFGRSLVR